MAIHRADEVYEGGLQSSEPVLRWRNNDVAGGVLPFTSSPSLASCVGAEQQVWLCSVHSSLTVVSRSMDHGLTWTAGNATGDAHSITDIAGEVDTVTGGKSLLYQLCSAEGKIYYSETAGDTWSSSVALPSTNLWARLRWSYEFNTLIAAGTNKIATSSNTMGYPTSFSAQTVPGAWSARVPGRIFQPTPGSNGHGVVMTASDGGDTRRVCYSLDATTWTETGIHATADGGVVWFTWSDYYQAWYCITKIGKVYKAATLDAAWVKVADFYLPSGTDRYRWIEAAGPFFVIHGTGIGASSAPPKAGNFMVTSNFKPATTTTFQEGGVSIGWSYGAQRHDHQLVAASSLGGSPPYGISIVRSGRAPWFY